MRHFLLMATALAAAPVMIQGAAAQSSGSTGTSSPTTSGAQGSAPAQTSTAPDGSTADRPGDQTVAQPPMAGAAPGTTSGADPVGGYQPALQPTISPGATIVFQQAPSVTEAYPPPAPLKTYPLCKKGQYDKCRQRGG